MCAWIPLGKASLVISSHPNEVSIKLNRIPFVTSFMGFVYRYKNMPKHHIEVIQVNLSEHKCLVDNANSAAQLVYYPTAL